MPFARLFGLGIAIPLALTLPVRAAEWFAPVDRSARGDWIVATDVSTTVTSTGSVYGAAAVTAAVTGALSESGARVRAEALGGAYRYRSGDGRSITGTQAEGGLLAGYEVVGARSAFSAYLGVSARNNAISVPDPTNTTTGTSFGFKAVLQGYWEPTERTMASAYGSYSTANNAYYTRVKLGADIGGRVFVGPEMSFLGDDFFRQWRGGLHVSGLRVGALELGLSGGVLKDRREGFGAYSVVDARMGF